MHHCPVQIGCLHLLARTAKNVFCYDIVGVMGRRRIFDLIRRLTTRWAIIEWVPATDSQFLQLCRGRQDIYGHLDENAFLRAADQHFVRRLVENLPNGRSLWLFETR